MSRYARLSAPDLINLAAESPDTPMHVGVLAVLDGASLCDADGRLRLAELRARIERRLAAVPRLRQVLHRAGPLAGRPVWVNDPHLRIEDHVQAVDLPSGDGEEALPRLTARLLETPLDRHRPLWRMWFVTGLPYGRVALVVALHHVLADGLATVRMLGALLDGPDGPPGPGPAPQPVPTWLDLVRDNLRGHRTHPHRRRTGSRTSALRGFARGLVDARPAPRTSLNNPLGPHRRLAVLRLDLATAKRVAHAHGATINDLVLGLIAGGLRELLTSRGEPVEGLAPRAAVAVSLRPAGDVENTGNVTGGMIVRLPVYEAEPGDRLRSVAAETARTKRVQSAAGVTGMLVWFTRLGVLRWLSRHQRAANVHESNVPGPPQPIRMLDAPVLDLVPVSMLSGNVGLGFLAFSYAGRLSITVLADADRFPDLPVLVAAMEHDRQALTGCLDAVPGAPGPADRPHRLTYG